MFRLRRFQPRFSLMQLSRRALFVGGVLLSASCAQSAISDEFDGSLIGTGFDAGGMDSGSDTSDTGTDTGYDAGTIVYFDATVGYDAGGGLDAGGTGSDGGTRDAGADASVVDAGPKDAGTVVDAGPKDAGAIADASTGSDAGTDAGVRDAGGTTDAGGGGSCTNADQCTNSCGIASPLRCCDQSKCGCTWVPGAYCAF